jgi:hypothetical protein
MASQISVDYNFFPGKQTGKGFYLLAGLGLARASLEVSGATAAASASTTVHKTTLYPEAGLGYESTRHLGLELLYKGIRYHDVGLEVGGESVGYSFSGAVQAPLVIRF